MGQECATNKDYEPKNSLSELMDLSETRAQVDGPPMHLTQLKTSYSYFKILANSAQLFLKIT